jgi:uncharacterized protein YqfA (UPF0365 family)
LADYTISANISRIFASATRATVVAITVHGISTTTAAANTDDHSANS